MTQRQVSSKYFKEASVPPGPPHLFRLSLRLSSTFIQLPSCLLLRCGHLLLTFNAMAPPTVLLAALVSLLVVSMGVPRGQAVRSLGAHTQLLGLA